MQVRLVIEAQTRAAAFVVALLTPAVRAGALSPECAAEIAARFVTFTTRTVLQ